MAETSPDAAAIDPLTHRYQDLSRFRLEAGFRGRSALVTQLWWLVQALLFNPSPQFLYGWRRLLLRVFGAKIGDRVLIRPSVRVTYPWRLEIGDSSWIGDNVELYTLGRITIGADAVVSQRSYLCTGWHDRADPSFAMRTAPVVVQDQAWVAADVFVAPGVTIGRGAVVGVRSLVLKDIPPGMEANGNPAKIRGPRPTTA
ncbi:putative colanic acid biosynthesis acetyltransferase [Mesorhizobium sp. BR1-1-16]|nr:putative colanic acid biosynthesis acetyltransferase [Mesorhizobium sp. BR1-1-16]